MMNELIDRLHIGQCSLALLHEGNTHTFEGRGVRMFYNLLNDESEPLFKSKIAIEAVSKTAVGAMADGGVIEVYADVISEEAHSRLEGAGVKAGYDRKIGHQRFLEIWKQMDEVKD